MLLLFTATYYMYIVANNRIIIIIINIIYAKLDCHNSIGLQQKQNILKWTKCCTRNDNLSNISQILKNCTVKRQKHSSH